MKSQRALSLQDVLSYKPKCLEFTGKWLESFGTPELKGCWLIWGNSGNGKTSFAIQLAKYLAQFGKVLYNSLEEGLCFSLQNTLRKEKLDSIQKNFNLLNMEPIDLLIERLKKRRSAPIIFVDSIQYTGLNQNTAKRLVDMFPDKLFIFISHAEGKQPAGRVAKAIKYHASVKLYVEGYAIPAPISRFKEGFAAPFVIWEEGAEKYWGTTFKK